MEGGRDNSGHIPWDGEVLFTGSTAAESVKHFEHVLALVLYLNSTGAFFVSSAV